MSFLFGFDVGRSSIGWSVLSVNKKFDTNPQILGCGSVIFPADDCLASRRHAYRRTRRNIRATRQRISRIKQLFEHLGVLKRQELDAIGHPAPHALAARALLADKPVLGWLELWHVLRWYAHNRGYDGNARWARHEADEEDTKKEKAAYELMRKHGTEDKSMAETICAVLGIDPLSEKISSAKPYKNLNVSFPRGIVRKEVREILDKHIGHLPNLNSAFVKTLVGGKGDSEHRAWETIPVPNLHLPRRYYGGLLFGQLVPRFDNRIIGRCPISGEKVPDKATREFLDYRWAMILANLRIEGKPLSVEQRQMLHERMKREGMMSPTELRKVLEELSGSEDNNVSAFFELNPYSKEALVYDPALALYNGHGAGSDKIKPYWKCLPEVVRKRALGRWKKGRVVHLAWMLDQCEKSGEGASELQKVIDKAFAKDQKKKKGQFLTKEHLLNLSFAPEDLSGRAPYARWVMRDVLEFVLSTNRHPSEAETEELSAGPIYRSKDIKSAEREVEITELTNNHLIRQRLDILLRLVDDMLLDYAASDTRAVSDIVVEVASDLQTYSGLTSKEIQGELAKRLSHFKSAVEKLTRDAPHLSVTGSLIRKCRIAMDLNWTCPFTLKTYEVHQLEWMEREHIIPYADRPTNALDALVLTFPEVNRMKGKRLAFKFVEEFQSMQVSGKPELSICSLRKYLDFVETLKLRVPRKRTHPEDYKRQSSRIKLLKLEQFDSRDQSFAPGALTQTSHLNRLSARQLEKRFIDTETKEPTVRIHSVPGKVTAETRKSWHLLGTLARACPEILNDDNRPKNKTEIREITHLHHALDAAVLGLTHFYLPGTLPGQIENEKGSIWRAMLKRNKNQDEQNLLLSTGMFKSHYRKDKQGNVELNEKGEKQLDVHLCDIPKEVKNNLFLRLAEKRVVQHIPADQSGSALEETTWRYLCDFEGQALLLQKIGRDNLKQDPCKSGWGWEDIERSGRQNKKLEEILADTVVSDSLKRNQIKSSLIRRGLIKYSLEFKHSLVGLESGVLKGLQAVRVIESNYGIVLGKNPRIIPFHKVPEELKQIRKQNNGKLPDLIRKGSLITVCGGTWKGYWRVISVKHSKAYGVSVDLVHPHYVKLGKGNAKIPDMIREGLIVHKCKLTGMCDIASDL